LVKLPAAATTAPIVPPPLTFRVKVEPIESVPLGIDSAGDSSEVVPLIATEPEYDCAPVVLTVPP
jgi:hypothetical protein